MKKIVFGFKVFYLINMLTAFITFYNYTEWFNYSNYILVLGTGVLAVWLLTKWRDWINKKNVMLILLFLLSYGFSSVMTMEFGVTDNLKEIIWLFLPMVVLYFSGFSLTKEEREKETMILGGVHIVYASIANAVSLSMVWWGRYYTFEAAPNSYRTVGFKWERLWGIYDDPNHGASIAFIAVMLAIFLIYRIKYKILRLLLAISIMVQCGYIICADSRATFGMLGVGLACWGFWIVYNKLKTKNGRYRILISSFVSIMICMTVVAGGYIGNEQYMKLDKVINAERLKRYPPKVTIPPVSGSRTQDLKEDSTSGRAAIWESGLEIAETSPIYGVSYRNIAAYAHEYVPDTYIINTKYGVDYDSMHNLLMDVLVSQGIVGILLILIIFIRSFLLFVRRYSKVERKDQGFLVLQLSLILGLGAGSMFLTTIIYLSGPHAYWFWMSLGGAVALLQETGQEKKRGVISWIKK